MQKTSLLAAACLLLSASLAVQAAENESLPADPVSDAWSSKRIAQMVSVGDSVSTHAAIQLKGAVEQNKLINSSPAGLLALLGTKLMTIEYADTLDQESRGDYMRTFSTIWGWGNANNFAVALGAATPVAWLAGLVTGGLIWNHQTTLIREENARREPLTPPELANALSD